jgi:hypothetical protein
MRTPNRPPTVFLLLITALLAASCGRRASAGDPYNGVIDASVLDAKFLPVTDRKLCPSGNCYPGQEAYAHGASLFFYNLGAPVSSSLGTLTAAHAAPVFELGSCVGDAAFDPQQDAFSNEKQLPVFSALPVASTSTTPVLPLVRVVPVVGRNGSACNELKDSASVGDSAGAPGEVKLRAVIDSLGAVLRPGSPKLKVGIEQGWFRGLLLGYLDGGTVPVDAKGNLVAMDGVILNPGDAVFARPTDPRAVLLPFVPGESGYSPIVRLHGFTLPAGKALGDYTGICVSGVGCGPNEVDYTLASKSAFNTLFIAASAP